MSFLYYVLNYLAMFSIELNWIKWWWERLLRFNVLENLAGGGKGQKRPDMEKHQKVITYTLYIIHDGGWTWVKFGQISIFKRGNMFQKYKINILRQMRRWFSQQTPKQPFQNDKFCLVMSPTKDYLLIISIMVKMGPKCDTRETHDKHAASNIV